MDFLYAKCTAGSLRSLVSGGRAETSKNLPRVPTSARVHWAARIECMIGFLALCGSLLGCPAPSRREEGKKAEATRSRRTFRPHGRTRGELQRAIPCPPHRQTPALGASRLVAFAPSRGRAHPLLADAAAPARFSDAPFASPGALFAAAGFAAVAGAPGAAAVAAGFAGAAAGAAAAGFAEPVAAVAAAGFAGAAVEGAAASGGLAAASAGGDGAGAAGSEGTGHRRRPERRPGRRRKRRVVMRPSRKILTTW